MCYLKLDGTEDDDEDDEVATDQTAHLVAKDVKTGTYAAPCLRERGVSEHATSWLVSLLRRLGLDIGERYCKVLESHRS